MYKTFSWCSFVLQRVAVSALIVLSNTTPAQAMEKLRVQGSELSQFLYASWAEELKEPSAISVDFESASRPPARRELSRAAFDVFAFEIALNRETLEQSRLVQLPVATAGIAIVANLGSVDASEIVLTPGVLSELLTGGIRRWNDPKLAAINPGKSLPDLPAKPLNMYEGSSAARVMSAYLAKAAPSSTGARLNTAQAANSNKEMGDFVQQQVGAIGYVELSFAREFDLRRPQLRNRWGELVQANETTIRQATLAFNWDVMKGDPNPPFDLDLTDTGCPRCWPIVQVSYAVLPLAGKQFPAAIRFVRRAIREGVGITEKLGFVALPPRAQGLVLAATNRLNQSQP